MTQREYELLLRLAFRGSVPTNRLAELPIGDLYEHGIITDDDGETCITETGRRYLGEAQGKNRVAKYGTW